MTVDNFNALGTAVLKLVEAFEEQNMNVAVIELGTWEDGQTLEIITKSEPKIWSKIVFDEETKEPKNQMEIAGVCVRWPVKRRALPSGGWHFI